MIIILRGHTGSGKSTLMNGLVNHSELNLTSMEVDKLKTENLHEPYKLASQELLKFLKSGKTDIIVAGAFNPQNRIDEFFNELGEIVQSERIIIIRIKCSLNSAIRRKQNVLSEEIVVGQVNRSWVDLDGEYIIDTEGMTSEQVLIKAFEYIKGSVK